MFSFLLAVVVAATAFFAGANAQGSLLMNTPTGVIQCQPQLLTWSGGTAPYFLSLLPGGQPSANPLVDFGRQNGTSLTWVVNYAAGTSLGFTLRDSTGATSQTAAFTVGTSSDTSCLTSSAGGSTRTGASTGTSATGVTTTTTGLSTLTSTTRTPNPTTNTNANTGATSTAAGSSPSGTGSSSSSGMKVIANSVMIGAVGAAILALLA